MAVRSKGSGAKRKGMRSDDLKNFALLNGGGFRPRRRLLRRWRSTWGRFPSRQSLPTVRGIRECRGGHRSRVVRVLRVVPWVQPVLGLRAVLAVQRILAVLALRRLQLVLELRLHLLGSGRGLLVNRGRRAFRVLRWVRVVRVVLGVLERRCCLPFLAVLVRRGFHWVRVGRVVLAGLLGMVCMAAGRQRRTGWSMAFLGRRGFLGLLGFLVCRAVRVVRLVRVLRRYNRHCIRRPDGRYGCWRLGCSSGG